MLDSIKNSREKTDHVMFHFVYATVGSDLYSIYASAVKVLYEYTLIEIRSIHLINIMVLPIIRKFPSSFRNLLKYTEGSVTINRKYDIIMLLHALN